MNLRLRQRWQSLHPTAAIGCVALLLVMLLSSQLAVAHHGHDDPNTSDCELCLHAGDVTAAVNIEPAPVTAPPALAVRAVVTCLGLRPARVLHIRGPPDIF